MAADTGSSAYSSGLAGVRLRAECGVLGTSSKWSGSAINIQTGNWVPLLFAALWTTAAVSEQSEVIMAPNVGCRTEF